MFIDVTNNKIICSNKAWIKAFKGMIVQSHSSGDLCWK